MAIWKVHTRDTLRLSGMLVKYSFASDLWDGWPVAELLDALPQLLVSKNIVASEGDVMHPHYLTNLGGNMEECEVI